MLALSYPNQIGDIMGRRSNRENRSKQQLMARAEKIGPLLRAALEAQENTSAKRAELDELVASEMAPALSAEQEAYRQLYEASLIPTPKGPAPEELVVTIGKGKERRKTRMLPIRKEIKQKDGRTIVRKPLLDEEGNPVLDGDNKPIMQAVVLRVEYGLVVVEETEPDRIEISLG